MTHLTPEFSSIQAATMSKFGDGGSDQIQRNRVHLIRWMSCLFKTEARLSFLGLPLTLKISVGLELVWRRGS